MKPLLYFLLLLTFGWTSSAQKFQLHINGSTEIETKIIDSLNYNSTHSNIKSLTDEINLSSEKLTRIGFIENQLLETKKENDSSFSAKINLGEKIKNVHIYLGKNATLFNLIALDKTKDTLVLAYEETEAFLNRSLLLLEKKGFAMAKLKLINIQKSKQALFADLQFDSGKPRQLNSIVVQFAETNKKNSFPEGHLKQINRKYKNRPFNQEIVKKIHNDFEKIRFVSQIKYPEILFTEDTTRVYVYLEKRKSNTFDGFIGFANNENKKIAFNGYLDLVLENAIKAGEQFSINWKSDGNDQTTFKTNIDLPYLFKSPIGLKAQLNIFKQDSLFQNTKTAIDLGYFIDYNTRVYLGYQSTTSSDIQNTNNNTLSDYENSFFTANLEFNQLDYNNTTFSKKTNITLSLGTGKRTTTGLVETLGTNKQLFSSLDAMHNFYFNKKNCFNVKIQNYILKSDSYTTNELYRFGGVNSIRGFAENSLQANFMAAIITEYRHIVSPDLFINTIIDYGYYEDQTTNNQDKLIGFGFGIGLQTRNGLLKIAFANGSTTNQEIKFDNTIVNINYSIQF